MSNSNGKLSVIPPGEFSPEEAMDILQNVTVTEPAAQKALDRLVERFDSGGPVNIQTLKDSIMLGRFSRVAGIRDLIRGLSLELQRMAIVVVQENQQHAHELYKAGKIKYAEQIIKCRISSADYFKLIIESQKLLLHAEGTLTQLPPGAQDNESPTAASFSPGQTVQPPKSGTVVIAQHAHFPQTKPDNPSNPPAKT